MATQYEKEVIGTLADPTKEESQEEININSLFIEDQVKFLNLIRERVSFNTLVTYFEDLKKAPVEFFVRALNILIEHYSINPLRVFLNDTGFVDTILVIDKNNSRRYYINVLRSNFYDEIRAFLIFLKVDFLKIIKEGGIESNTELEVVKVLVKEKAENISTMFQYLLDFIDKESYQEFMKTIVQEANSDYSEYQIF